MRRTIALALLAVLALVAAPSRAAVTVSGVNQVLVIEKVDQRSRGPELRFSITATATGETGALAMAGTVRSRPRSSANGFFGYTDVSSATVPSSYGFGAPQWLVRASGPAATGSSASPARQCAAALTAASPPGSLPATTPARAR